MPAKLFKSISPKKFNPKAFDKAAKQVLEEVGEGIKRDFEKTTRTWTTRVVFKKRKRFWRKPYSVEISTVNQVYFWVVRGTKKHEVGKEGQLMAFQPTVQTKSTPRLISSRKGRKRKQVIVARGPWTVKGIEARDFDKVLRDRWQKKFSQMAKSAIRQATRSSNHSMR